MLEKPKFETRMLKDYMTQAGLAPMDLVRICGIAISTAYRIEKGKQLTDLSVFYKVYITLKAAGHNVTWKQLTGIE